MMNDTNRKEKADKMARGIMQELLANDDGYLIVSDYDEDLETFKETNKELEEKFNVKCYPIPEHENISVYIFNYVPESEREKILEEIHQRADEIEATIKKRNEQEEKMKAEVEKFLDEFFGMMFG